MVTEILSKAPYLAKDQSVLTDYVRASRRVKMKALSIRIFLISPGFLMGPFLRESLDNSTIPHNCIFLRPLSLGGNNW